MGVLTALGIDLGTTESVAVVYVDEVDGVPAHSVKVKLSPTKDSLPSVVCKTKEKTWLVGEPAIVYHKMNPDTILLSRTKRLLGLTYAQAKKEGILKDLKYDVIEGSGNNAEKPVVIVGACPRLCASVYALYVTASLNGVCRLESEYFVLNREGRLVS